MVAAVHGITVTPAIRDGAGNVSKGKPFQHLAVLSGVHADSPARSKLMYSLGSWTAYFVCAFCKLVGTKAGKVVRYLGFAAPVLTTAGVGAGESIQMGAQGRLLTEAEMRAQAIAAEYHKARGLEPHPGNRFKGYSPLVRSLYWVDIRTLWVIPFCHAFFLGVFKDYVKLACAKKAQVRTHRSLLHDSRVVVVSLQGSCCLLVSALVATCLRAYDI